MQAAQCTYVNELVEEPLRSPRPFVNVEITTVHLNMRYTSIGREIAAEQTEKEDVAASGTE